MVRSAAGLIFALLVCLPALSSPVAFPAGTSQFFRTYAADAIPASGGGVWLALPAGIVRYDAAGASTTLPTPGGRPTRLAQASDGTIWFANAAGIGRVSATGQMLAQYPLAGVMDIAVASDGALWYIRAFGTVIGRIAAGAQTEFPAPADAWSIAAAPEGTAWVLGTGFGTANDSLYRLTPAGQVTAIPVGDGLFGQLQPVADGTLYISTGIRKGLLRLRPGANSVESIAGFDDFTFLADDAHSLWSETYGRLTYRGADGVRRFTLVLPQDPRSGTCSNTPLWAYEPLAIDAAGGLWLRVSDQAGYLPTVPPCELPEPPEMPTLIRLDIAAVMHAHMGHDVPALSPSMLAALGALIALAALLRLWR